MAWDFGLVHDFAVLFGAATEEETTALLTSLSYRVTASPAPYRGRDLELELNGSNLALGFIQAAIYPAGWSWPHNPQSPIALISNYLCDMRSMRTDTLNVSQTAADGC